MACRHSRQTVQRCVKSLSLEATELTRIFPKYSRETFLLEWGDIISSGSL